MKAMNLQDRLTIDTLLPGYFAACARREFDAALEAQQAAIANLAEAVQRRRTQAALEAQQDFWKSRGLQ